MFATLLLVGHPARRARKLSREAISSPRVLSSLGGSFLYRVSSLTLHTCCWLNPHRYGALAYLQGSRTPRSCRGVKSTVGTLEAGSW
jgi:hypothetical protein